MYLVGVDLGARVYTYISSVLVNKGDLVILPPNVVNSIESIGRATSVIECDKIPNKFRGINMKGILYVKRNGEYIKVDNSNIKGLV